MASIVPVNATTYQVQLGTYGLVTIGGGPQFMPKTSLAKWGEVSLAHTIVSPTAVPPILQSSKQLSWQNNTLGMTVLWDVLDPTDQFEDGGIDISIITTKAALQAGISFPMNMAGLIAEYQPALTANDIAHGSSRPVNVVGSYAFSHATKGGMNETSVADTYKTGKAFHLFAPKFTDQLGKTIYGTWNLVGNTLTPVVDPAWVAAATDPIALDPTFGYSSIGASQDSDYAGYTEYRQMAQTSPAGTNTLTKLSIYAACASGTDTYQLGLYSEKAGPAPDQRQVYDTSTWTITTTAQWWDSSAWSFALAASTQYWAGTGDSGTHGVFIYYDTGTNHRFYGDTSIMPATAGTGSGDDGSANKKWSIYGTYTAAGGAVLDEDGLTHQFVTRW